MRLRDVLDQRRTHAIERLASTSDAELPEIISLVDSVIHALLEDGDPRIFTVADEERAPEPVYEFGSDKPIWYAGIDLGVEEDDITIIRANTHSR